MHTMLASTCLPSCSCQMYSTPLFPRTSRRPGHGASHGKLRSGTPEAKNQAGKSRVPVPVKPGWGMSPPPTPRRLYARVKVKKCCLPFLIVTACALHALPMHASPSCMLVCARSLEVAVALFRRTKPVCAPRSDHVGTIMWCPFFPRHRQRPWVG